MKSPETIDGSNTLSSACSTKNFSSLFFLMKNYFCIITDKTIYDASINSTFRDVFADVSSSSRKRNYQKFDHQINLFLNPTKTNDGTFICFRFLIQKYKHH